MKYNIDITSIALAAILAFILFTKDEPQNCHTFQPTDSSHIRMNTCTGDAHVIVRGPNGFEWRVVND